MALFRGVQSLNFEDSAAVNAVKHASVHSLEKCFGFLKDSKVHILATILDPNTKLDFVGDNSNFLNFNKLDCQTVFMDYFSAKLPCESFSETQIIDTCPEKSKRPRIEDLNLFVESNDHLIITIKLLATRNHPPALREILSQALLSFGRDIRSLFKTSSSKYCQSRRIRALWKECSLQLVMYCVKLDLECYLLIWRI